MKHLFLFILLTKLVSSAPCQDEVKLEGDVFIVTKGAENVRLGAVEIRLYQTDTMRDHLAKRNDRVKAEMPNFDSAITTRNARIAVMNKEIAKLKALGGVRTKTAEEFVRLMGISRDRDILAKATWPTAQHYFRNFPETTLSTRTDADGKFSISFPKGQRYVLAAHAARVTDSVQERYYWLIRVSDDAHGKKILLSNHNLVVGDSPESALHAKSEWHDWSEP